MSESSVLLNLVVLLNSVKSFRGKPSHDIKTDIVQFNFEEFIVATVLLGTVDEGMYPGNMDWFSVDSNTLRMYLYV